MLATGGKATQCDRSVSASRKTQFTVVFFTILLSTIGFGVCIPVLPLYAKAYGASEWVNGLLTGVFPLMVFVAAPLWGRLADRVGRRPVLIASVLGSAAGYFLMGFAHTLPLLFLARMIDGASGGNVAAAQAYIADITSPQERSKAMGMIGAAFGMGFIIGPAIGGIAAQISPQAPFFLVGILCLVNAVLIWTSLPESLTPERRNQHGPAQPLSALPQHADGPVYFRVAVSNMVCLAAFSIMTAVFSLFAQERFGMDEQHVGYVMASIGCVGVIMQGGVIRRLLPLHGEIRLAIAGMAILLVSFVLLPLHAGTWGLYGVSCLIAVGNSLVQPTLSGLASRSVACAWQGRAMGLLQSAASLGRTIGPVLGGWLLGFDRGSPNYGRTPFWVAAGLMAVTLLIACRLREPVAFGEDASRQPVSPPVT